MDAAAPVLCGEQRAGGSRPGRGYPGREGAAARAELEAGTKLAREPAHAQGHVHGWHVAWRWSAEGSSREKRLSPDLQGRNR